MGNDHSTEKKKHNAAVPKVEIPPGAEVIGNYLVEQILGKGSFAEVKLGQNIHTGDKVALKLISKQNLNKGKRRVHLQREIRFMKLLSHPHIAVLYDVVEREDSFVLIMEHAGGGELLEYIRNSDKHRINEKEARRLFRQIVSAVDYCHKNNLIHRDLKPENVLLDDHTDAKIIDFGFSREFTGDMQLDSFIGSPHYAAPELLQGIKYSGPEVDIWSLGILLYVMICGKQPFKHPDMKMLYAKITKGEFEHPEWVSSSARDLINSILQVDPKRRCSMEQIKNHKWMVEGYDGPPNNYLEPRPHLTSLDSEIVDELEKYGFERAQLEATLLKNEQLPVLNFYHLLAERKRQISREPTDMETEHQPNEGEETMVTRVETDERIPISSVEKNLRRQIIRRQSTQNEILKRGDRPKSSYAEPMAEE